MEPTSVEVNALPAELSYVPFLKLKKFANNFDLLSGEKIKSRKTDNQYHRDNKNRPREISSKKASQNSSTQSSSHIEQAKRDPRFDNSSGAFNQKVFDDNYKFLHKIRKKEKKSLRLKLMDAKTSAEEREKIKFILQRQENQLRELKKKNTETKLIDEKRNYEIIQLKQGKQPFYQKKSAQKLLQLAEQFEELKKKGSLTKHMKRLRKKKASKDRAKINVTV